jgi:Spy/CpxP family protein refolding chaperone
VRETKARRHHDEEDEAMTQTMQRVTTVFLMAAAIAVVALVSVRAHAQGPGGPGGMHGGLMKRMISAALDEALDQAAVSAEQRTAIHASRDRAFAAMEAQRPDRGAQREQVLALFEGDRLDATQLQAVHAQMEERHQAMGAAITQAIVEIHDTLTPAQRQIVANYARTHGPRGMR